MMDALTEPLQLKKEYVKGMGHRSDGAAMRDAPTNPSSEEYVKGMGLRLKITNVTAAMMDALNKPLPEEYA